MPNIHPLIVHFPIALIIVIFILDFLGALVRNKSLFSAANILTIFAAAAAVVAVISGLMAEESVWHPDQAHELLELHETIGLAVLGLTLILLIFRPVVKKKKSRSLGWIAVLISLAAAILVGYEGYLGGEIVYKHGAGVRQAEIATARADSLSALLEENAVEKPMIDEEKQHDHDHEH